MNNIVILIICLLCFNLVHSQDQIDSLWNELDLNVYNKIYETKKQARIDSLKMLLENPGIQSEQSYGLCNHLFEEYRSYKFDSAIHYLNRNLRLSEKFQIKEWLNETKLHLSDVLTTSGMYKEAIDILYLIDKKQLSDGLRSYYFLCNELVYIKLAEYANDKIFAPEYKRKGRAYRDSFLYSLDPKSDSYLITLAVTKMENNELEKAKRIFTEVLKKTKQESDSYPIIANLLANLYQIEGNVDLQKKFLIISAISDIELAKKENASLRELAILLYQNGEIERAYEYLKIALADANFYGARQRALEISKIQPIIEEAYQRVKERQQTKLRLYLALISILSFFLIVALFYIYKQIRKLSIAHKDLNKANSQLVGLNQDLKNVNTQLQNLNVELQDLNNKLKEANKIKEEYIGYFFNINADFFQKIERFKRSVEQKISERKLDEVRFLINNINIKKEKEELLKSFDKVFLKLFPNFVQEFNNLFKEEDQIKLRDNELLNTDLRIFALIRMGINQNEKIAQILEYSVNTIYTYKTKIKNRTVVPKEEFEKRIMEIKSI